MSKKFIKHLNIIQTVLNFLQENNYKFFSYISQKHYQKLSTFFFIKEQQISRILQSGLSRKHSKHMLFNINIYIRVTYQYNESLVILSHHIATAYYEY